MPYVKPETLIKAQYLAQKELDNDTGDDSEGFTAASQLLEICPVCDDYDCGKMVVKANGVYVHPEDVDEADEIERGELP